MKLPRVLFALFLICSVALCGCGTAIKTEALADNLPPILERHNAYVGIMLTGEEAATALAEAVAVGEMFDLNRYGTMPVDFAREVVPVLDRHDAWVRNDTNLTDIKKRVCLNSSYAVRLLVQRE